jgi:hypothetical protein
MFDGEPHDDLSANMKSPSQLSIMRDKMSVTDNLKAVSRKNILTSSVLTAKNNARSSAFQEGHIKMAKLIADKKQRRKQN